MVGRLESWRVWSKHRRRSMMDTTGARDLHEDGNAYFSEQSVTGYQARSATRIVEDGDANPTMS